MKPVCISDQPIMRCLTCGTETSREIYTMHCVLCEKLILSDTGDDEKMVRLMQIGELQLRRVECSFDDEYYMKDRQTGEMVKVKHKRAQTYGVCGDCIRKEKAEEEQEREIRRP